MKEGRLIWFITIFNIVLSTLRALNVGYNAYLYAFSAFCYLIMAWHDKNNTRLLVTNLFYLATALVAIYRWFGI